MLTTQSTERKKDTRTRYHYRPASRVSFRFSKTVSTKWSDNGNPAHSAFRRIRTSYVHHNSQLDIIWTRYPFLQNWSCVIDRVDERSSGYSLFTALQYFRTQSRGKLNFLPKEGRPIGESGDTPSCFPSRCFFADQKTTEYSRLLRRHFFLHEL